MNEVFIAVLLSAIVATGVVYRHQSNVVAKQKQPKILTLQSNEVNIVKGMVKAYGGTWEANEILFQALKKGSK